MSRQMHLESELVHQSIKKTSISSSFFNKLCLSFPPVTHWPRLISPQDILVAEINETNLVQNITEELKYFRDW